MTPWQEHELTFWRTWLPANRPQYSQVFQRYAPLIPYVDPTGIALDIGCGPFPYSKSFAFDQFVLVDPLIHEYQHIEGTSINWRDGCVTAAQDIPSTLPYQTAFVLNCLDHMPRDERHTIARMLRLLRPQTILVHVNLRRQNQLEDVHPFPFAPTDLDELDAGFGTRILERQADSDDTYNGEIVPALQRVYRKIT